MTQPRVGVGGTSFISGTSFINGDPIPKGIPFIDSLNSKVLDFHVFILITPFITSIWERRGV